MGLPPRELPETTWARKNKWLDKAVRKTHEADSGQAGINANTYIPRENSVEKGLRNTRQKPLCCTETMMLCASIDPSPGAGSFPVKENAGSIQISRSDRPADRNTRLSKLNTSCQTPPILLYRLGTVGQRASSVFVGPLRVKMPLFPGSASCAASLEVGCARLHSNQYRHWKCSHSNAILWGTRDSNFVRCWGNYDERLTASHHSCSRALVADARATRVEH